MANGISVTSYKKRGGNVTYNLRVRRKGNLVTDHFTSKRAAERAGIKIVAAIDDGTYQKKDSDPLAKMTFAEGIDRYLDDEMVKAKKGYEQECYKANYMKSAKFAKKPLIKIKTSDLAQYRDSRMLETNPRTGKKLSPQTIRNDFTIIKGVFSLAISEWGFDTLINPSIGIRLPKPSKGRVKRLNEGEEEAILKLAREDTERVWLAPFIEFTIHTGMRLSEICRIETKHVNLQSQLIHLPETKNNTSPDMPIPPLALKVLQDFKPHWGKETLFGVKTGTVQAVWSKLKKKLEKEGKLQTDWHFHDFRHEACSRMVEIYGLDISEIQLVSRHDDWNTLKRYINITPQHVLKRYQETR